MPVLQDGELVLYGFVGETYFEQGFTSQDVLNALAEVGRDADITVRMNSGGGYVHEGLAIYNALVAHKGEVTVQVDSIVASSASLIAMAGDRIAASSFTESERSVLPWPGPGTKQASRPCMSPRKVLQTTEAMLIAHRRSGCYVDRTTCYPSRSRLPSRRLFSYLGPVVG